MYSKAIASDANQNVYITGLVNYYGNFNSGEPDIPLTIGGSTDIFLLKLNADGSFGYLKQIGGSAEDAAFSMICSGNSLIMSGYCSNTVDFDPGPASYTLASFGWFDAFIAKYSLNGELDWAKRIGSKNDDFGYSLSSDAGGNIYSAGYFQGPMDFDPGLSSDTVNSPKGVFLLKLNASGGFEKKWSWTCNFHYYDNPAIDGWYWTNYYGHDFPPSVHATTCGITYVTINAIDTFAAGEGASLIMVDTCSVFTGIREFEKNNQISVFPNPAKDVIHIESPLPMQSARLTDVHGGLLKIYSALEINSLPVSDLKEGVYFLEIIGDKITERRKILISRN